MFFSRKVSRFSLPSVIGIVGAARGSGTTTLSVASAAYLSKEKALKTAVIEVGERIALSRMTTKTLVFGNPIPGFCMQGIDFFSNASPDQLSRLTSAGYDRIILDFQEASDFLVSYRIPDRMIFLGDTAPWSFEDFERLMHSLILSKYEPSQGIFSGRNPTTESCRHFQEEFGQKLLTCPLLPDPFCPSEEARRGLSALLKE